jgi:hypothetical protein
VDGAVLGTATLSNGVAAIPASTTGLSAGVYTVVASYSGDTQYSPSTSTTLNVTVTGASATTTTLTASPNPVGSGQNVTLTATVKKTSGTGTPTGNVSFKYGSIVLGTLPLSSGVATVSASTTGYAVGTYSITASYAGDANDLASSSSAANLVIKDATKTVLSITPSSVVVGASVTLKATVTATAGGTPTGTVAFVYNGSTLTSGTLSGGVYSVTVPTTGYPAGTYSLTAVYGGDTAQAGSTSTAENLTLTP